MKSRMATCAMLAGALIVSGCKTVKYPGASDETAPSAVGLTLETEADGGNQKDSQNEKHRLYAAVRPVEGGVTTMAAATIAENATIVIRATARDDESGIKTLRVAGITKVCQSEPSGRSAQAVEYRGGQDWVFKDFAPKGKGRIPKQASVQGKVSVASLMRGTRPDGTEVTGDNATFQFALEAVNGRGLQSSSQWLEYRVGKVACP